MLGLIIEFCLVVGWFAWLHRKDTRERERASRIPHKQMRLELESELEEED
jgi:hypothetical protein